MIKWEQHVHVDATKYEACLSSLEGWVRWMLHADQDSVVLGISTGIWHSGRRECRGATTLLLKLAKVWQNHPRAKYMAIVFAETTSQHPH
jgi:hypothetical protein